MSDAVADERQEFEKRGERVEGTDEAMKPRLASLRVFGFTARSCSTEDMDAGGSLRTLRHYFSVESIPGERCGRARAWTDEFDALLWSFWE